MDLLKERLVIGISSRALFDLEKENALFEERGLEVYAHYQIEHEDEKLYPGTAFPLVKALLEINNYFDEPIVEVIIMSRNNPETGLRVFNTIEAYHLNITRAAFTGGEPIASYLQAFAVDLFLSRNNEDVQEAIDSGIAAAVIYDFPEEFNGKNKEIRIAFDADAVLFSDESELIYKKDGIEAFIENERKLTHQPLPEGPFSRFLLTLSKIKEQEKPDERLLRIAIVTARNSPAHKRVILTLRQWGVDVDEAFFFRRHAKRSSSKSF